MTAAAAKPAMKKVAEAVSSVLTADIYRCSLKKQTGVSLQFMMAHGASPSDRSMLQAAQFLQQELPVRLAHRVTELENLPFGLSTKAPVLKVRDWYVDSFRDIQGFPEIKSMNDERQFTELLHSVRMRHNNVMPTMAMGVNELKRELAQRKRQQGKLVLEAMESTGQGHSYTEQFQALRQAQSAFDDLSEIHQFLDRFYMSRIGIRMLIGQHVALHNTTPPPHYIGLICTQVRPVEIAQNAADDARSACMRTYGSAPDVEIYGDPSFAFAYVSTHLHQMIFELCKNSLRAVQERFADSDREPPPVRIVVAQGIEDITIKLSDEGGGIPRSGLPRIWTYLYSTASSPIATEEELQEMPTVMAGYGYGLPISRLYARYFGGDLQVVSMEGYGTDVYLHLNRLGNVQEPLP